MNLIKFEIIKNVYFLEINYKLKFINFYKDFYYKTQQFHAYSNFKS